MSDGPKDPSAASTLAAGMASLTFTALNEPSAENPGQGNHGTEEGNKKDRRRTASLERYRYVLTYITDKRSLQYV